MRALYAKYAGSLYQVRRMSDNTTKDISVLAAGGFADSKSQDSFCGASHCVIWRIYDQVRRGRRGHSRLLFAAMHMDSTYKAARGEA